MSGLRNPGAFVLERDNLWLRDAFAASDDEREAFWAKLDRAKAGQPDEKMALTLQAAIPATDQFLRVTRRSAGVGSLGRARYVALGTYRGGPFAAEIKAALPSCWADKGERGLVQAMAIGSSRSPDPALHYGDDFVVRRLAPNSRKVDFADIAKRDRYRLVEAMGREIGSLHGQAENAREGIKADLKRVRRDWLMEAIDTVAEATMADFHDFQAFGVK